MNNCLFCKIIKKEIPSNIVYEDDYVLAFLDIAPVSLGHTLVIPKQHHKNFSETPDELLEKISVVTKKISLQIQKKLKPTGFNFLSNQEAIAGQVIFHFHQHIIPKYVKENGLMFNKNVVKSNVRLEELKKEIYIE